MNQHHNHSHKIGHRGVYKYVLTKGQNGWRVSVVNGTPEETDPKVIESILNEALANLKATLPT